MAIVPLIGEHIGYSASPAMHAAAFATLGLDHLYVLSDVDRDALPALVDGLRRETVLGANVTVPHKAAVIELLDEVDGLARRAGAVNTIVNRHGRLIGSNTDAPAIAGQIKQLTGAPAKPVVLGNGGAARAVESALAELGAAQPTIISRANWSDMPELIKDADLLVNATPIGTNANESPVDPDLLHPGLAVLDLVYRPSPTRLIHDARVRGLEARAGAGVLLGQGWRSLQAWLGIELTDEVKRAMAGALAAELGRGADV